MDVVKMESPPGPHKNQEEKILTKNKAKAMGNPVKRIENKATNIIMGT